MAGGAAACCDRPGKRREKEHSERRWAGSGDGKGQTVPNDRTNALKARIGGAQHGFGNKEP